MEEEKIPTAVIELHKALTAFQGEVTNPRYDAEVSYSGRTFRYATLQSVFNTIRPVMFKHGLSITQTLSGNQLVTTLRHIAGGIITSVCDFNAPTKFQDFGSALTYLKRYSLCALLGIAGEEDDDANIADNTGEQPQPKASKKRTVSKQATKQVTNTAAQPNADVASVCALLDTFTTYEQFVTWGKENQNLKSNAEVYAKMKEISLKLKTK